MTRRGPSGPARVLCVDKPAGPTSFDVVRAVRRASGQRRVGHSGTLDPFASGVLVLGLGAATRLLGILLHGDKVYRARVRFGVETDSGDPTGEVVRESPVSFDDSALERALEDLTGEIEQTPPRLSAIRIDGRRSYERARAGEEFDLPARRVRVHAIECIERGDAFAELRVECSGGTYVRSLARDLGHALGCGAHLEALRRDKVGPFTLDDAVALDEVTEHWDPVRQCLPPSSLVRDWPRLALDAPAVEAVRHGRQPEPGWWRGTGWERLPDEVALVDADGRLVATAQRIDDERLALRTVLPVDESRVAEEGTP